MSSSSNNIDLQQLLEAGVHFGHQAHRWNPKMREYIYADRDGVHIFDLVKTAEKLEEAMNFARTLGKQGKNLVFVGTKRQAQDVVRQTAESVDAMYITTRWLGGFLTNFEQVFKSIDKMNRFKSGLATGKYDHYTKFERNQMQKDIDRLERFFEGVAKIKTVPDAIFVVDIMEEEVAAKEAARMGIPVIALVDSNGNPELAQYVVPGNDDAVSSVTLLCNMIATAYNEGKKSRGGDKETMPVKAE